MGHDVTSADSWKTPAIREAEARLAEAEAGLERAIAEAKKVDKAIPKTGLSKEDVEKIEAFARGKDAPKELRELQKRVDAGDLSWQDIASGRHLDDPSVRAALSAGTPDLRRAYTMVQEGEHLDDIIEAGAMSAASSAYTSPTGPAGRAAADDDYDDEDGGGPIMR